MDVITILAEKLATHPELTFTTSAGSVWIAKPSPNGFEVRFTSGADEWTVFLGESGFHEHFTDPRDALNLVAMCYSRDTRLREVKRGKTTVRASLECLSDNGWEEQLIYGLIFKPFWRQRTESIYQNPHLLRD